MKKILAEKNALSSTGPAGAPALSFRNVTCAFPDQAGSKAYVAVKDVSLDIEEGQFVSLVGPTGCGKSTLLNSAAGLLQPTGGHIALFGSKLCGINRRAGYMFQSEALMPWRNALDNIGTSLEYRGVPRNERRKRANEWLERVGLADAGFHYPHQLSGGMRKRVALAQMLISDPQIFLMDEPFSALDIQTRHLMENELLQLWSDNRKSVLFITHDLEEAISLSDRVVVLSAGPATRIVGDFQIDLPRPRDVAEIRMTPRFLSLHSEIWNVMRNEVMKSYEQHMRVR